MMVCDLAAVLRVNYKDWAVNSCRRQTYRHTFSSNTARFSFRKCFVPAQRSKRENKEDLYNPFFKTLRAISDTNECVQIVWAEPALPMTILSRGNCTKIIFLERVWPPLQPPNPWKVFVVSPNTLHFLQVPSWILGKPHDKTIRHANERPFLFLWLFSVATASASKFQHQLLVCAGL